MLVAPLALQNNIGQDELLKQLLDCLDDICERIAEKFKLYDVQGRARKAFIIDTLMKYNCYGCIAKLLVSKHDGRADAIYIENHALAVNLLVEMLRFHFNVNNLPLDAVGDFCGNFGRMDVVVVPTNSGVILEAKDKVIIIEVKTGKGFSYVQLLRYMFEKPNATAILWRVAERQVIVLEGKKLQRLLMLSAMAAIHRGVSILRLTDVACNHDPCRVKKATMEDQKHVENFLEELQESISKVVETVSRLLN